MWVLLLQRRQGNGVGACAVIAWRVVRSAPRPFNDPNGQFQLFTVALDNGEGFRQQN